jgi:hypothetical protein
VPGLISDGFLANGTGLGAPASSPAPYGGKSIP